MDTALFAVFNAHDAEQLMAMFTDNLEFYSNGLNDYAKTSYRAILWSIISAKPR